MTDLTIRRATIGDARAATLLIHWCVQEVNSADYPPDEVSAICRDFSFEKVGIDIVRRYTCVAYCDGDMVGTAAYGGRRLHALFVNPDHLCKSVGRNLVSHIENVAREDDASHLVLSSSLTAIPFYERLGYTKREFEHRPYGATWKMSKALW